MKKLFTIIFLLCIAKAMAVSDKWQLEVSENNRFLQTADGKPFFWLGDTGWLLPERLTREEADGYLQRAADAGFNVVQVQVINGVPAINAYGQMSNISKQNPWDFSGINREGVYGYWDHMDYIVKAAERRGIYIGMVCIWGGLVKGGLIDRDGARSYGRFLAERYKDAPNIIWFMGGDIQGDIKPEVWNALAESIKEIDKKHLMTYHPRGRYTSARWWAKAEWMDFHTYQSGHRAYGQRMGNKDYPIPDNTEEDCWMYVDSTWAYKPLKPVIDAEPSYEDIPIGLHFPKGPRWQAADVRRYAYWDVFAGACGHTYGHNAIMQMAKPGYSIAYSETSVPYYEAQQRGAYLQMRYLKALMLTFPFFCRVPDQEVIAVSNGTRYDRLIATRGDDYLLVYNYTGRKMTVNLSKISGEAKDVWWMDAASGALTYMGRYTDKVATLSPARNKASKKDSTQESIQNTDGILIATDSSKDYIRKEQKNIIPAIGKDDKGKQLTE